MERIVLGADPIPAPFDPRQISQDDFERSSRLLSWSADRQGRWTVARAKPHVAGRLICNDHLFVVPPELDTRLFVGLVCYAQRLKLPAPSAWAGALLSARDEHDAFLVVLAALMIQASEELLSVGVNKFYQLETQLSQTVRGRVKWSASFARPLQEGVVCEFWQMQVDNELNRLVLAGVEAAAAIAPSMSASRQVFAWRGLCRRAVPTPARFDRAISSMNRRTIVYRRALTLARMLLYGIAVDDLFHKGTDDFPEMQFNLANIFEMFLERLLCERFEGTAVRVEGQDVDYGAILRANGATYQRVRPDLRFYNGDRVLAVFDVKYKSRYLSGERISEPDLYQTHFYISRATSGERPLVAAGVLAPLVDGMVLSNVIDRHIVFPSRDARGLHLKILPVEISAVLRALEDGLSAKEAMRATPELDFACESIEYAAEA